MNRSPLLDFRERRVCYWSLAYGSAQLVAIQCGLLILGVGWIALVAGIIFSILAKYAHSKLPVKRKRKEKASNPGTPQPPPADLFTRIDR